jgi:polyhydroxyalkanoate synthesis regulator phasin
MAFAAAVLAAGIVGFTGVLVNRRTTKGNVATATASDVLNAFDKLQIGQRAEMDRMQAVIDVLRPALASAEESGALKATEIVRLHGLIDALEVSVRALRGGLEGAVA